MKARYVNLSRDDDDRSDEFDFLDISGAFHSHHHDHAQEDHADLSGASALFVAEGSSASTDAIQWAEQLAQQVSGVTGAPGYAVDALMSGRAWTKTKINYVILDSAPDYAPMPGFSSLSRTQRDSVERIVDMLEQYTPLKFRETSIDKSHIAIGNADFGAGAGGYGFYPSGNRKGTIDGDIFINSHYSSQLKATAGKFGHMSLMHEFGHALGLEHSHEGNVLPRSEDSRQFTVESYNSHGKMGRVEPHTFMTFDIAALQEIYGVNRNWASGDDVYDYSKSKNLVETIWDAGGTDTITVADSSVGAVIDLTEGAYSSIGLRGRRLAQDNIAIAYGAVIENAEGSAHDDRLMGNTAANTLSGLEGNDALLGGAGADRFVFGSGTGSDLVEDFENGRDLIVLTVRNLDYDDLQITNERAGARIAFGEDSVLLEGVSVRDLDPGDFVFA